MTSAGWDTHPQDNKRQTAPFALFRGMAWACVLSVPVWGLLWGLLWALFWL